MRKRLTKTRPREKSLPTLRHMFETRSDEEGNKVGGGASSDSGVGGVKDSNGKNRGKEVATSGAAAAAAAAAAGRRGRSREAARKKQQQQQQVTTKRLKFKIVKKVSRRKRLSIGEYLLLGK